MTRKRKPAPPPAPEHPWDRQIGETDSAWNNFTIYRDMGPRERSIAKATKKQGKTARRATVTLERQSRKWGWVARCHAYDSWVDKQMRDSDLEERKEMNRIDIQQARAFKGIVALAINKIITAEKNGVELTLKPSEVKEFAAYALMAERLARGEPDSIREQRHELAVPEKRDGLRGGFSDEKLRDATRKAAEALIAAKAVEPAIH